MSNQYIIKFSNKNYEEPVDAYAEFITTDYSIPILIIKPCEDKTQILLYHFITNNFGGNVHFEDEKLEFTLTCQNICYKIMFDKNSSSAFTQFKNQLTTFLNSKFETEYYPSGYVFYVGEVLYSDDGKQKKRVPNGNGIMYYDLPYNKIKYVGEFENGNFDGVGIFYNKKGNISLKVNNISNGIPTQKGKLEVNFRSKKEVVQIDFFELWDTINCLDNKSKVNFVISDNFLDVIAFKECYYDDMSYEEVLFDNKTTDEKLVELWKLIKTTQQTQKTNHLELVKITSSIQIFSIFFDFVIGIILIILTIDKV
jgi:hypothetical protein